MNHSRASWATASSVPGSSKRCVAPGTISSFFSQRSCESASLFMRITGVSSPPTMSSVGARTRANADPGEVRPPAARHHCAYDAGPLGGRNQCRPAAGACAEVTDPEITRGRSRSEPVGGPDESLGEQGDVEAKLRRSRIDLLFVLASASRRVRFRGRPGEAPRRRTDCAGYAGCCRFRARTARRRTSRRAGPGCHEHDRRCRDADGRLLAVPRVRSCRCDVLHRCPSGAIERVGARPVPPAHTYRTPPAAILLWD